ncbi:MAG: hypothetical protein ABGX08_02665 [Citromicrobium sp.]
MPRPATRDCAACIHCLPKLVKVPVCWREHVRPCARERAAPTLLERLFGHSRCGPEGYYFEAAAVSQERAVADLAHAKIVGGE